VITDKQLADTLEWKSAPRCAAANGGVQCDQPVVQGAGLFPHTNPCGSASSTGTSDSPEGRSAGGLSFFGPVVGQYPATGPAQDQVLKAS
jgi:hypothetical protein